MVSRNVIVSLLGILFLVAALTSGAGAGAQAAEHHQSLTLANEHADHHRPVSPAAGGNADSSESQLDEQCSPAAHACCPGLAANLPMPACRLVLDDGSARVAFTPTLHRMSRVEGIYKPPWLYSLV